MHVAILFPTFNRVEQARRCLDEFIRTAPAATCVVVTEDDPSAFGSLLDDEHILFVPHYRSWCLDVETNERARHFGEYAWAANAMVEHRHVHFGKATMDDTYKRGYGVHAYDQLILQVRRKHGYPNDFQAVIG